MFLFTSNRMFLIPSLSMLLLLPTYSAANGNGKQSMPISSPNPSQSHTNRLPPKDKSAAQLKEFTFQAVHDAFGREINQDLQERRRLKELAQRPLIEI